MATALLFRALELLAHPLVQGTQFQACLILCVGVVGWTLSGVRRRRERLRLQAAGYGALLQQLGLCAGMQEQGQLQEQEHGGASSSSTSTPPASPAPGAVFKSSVGSAAAAGGSWPPLAVVLPVKGCRPHSCDNWASQLQSHYEGPSVFVFAVESAADPAVAAVTQLLQQQQQGSHNSKAAAWTPLMLPAPAGTGQREHKQQQQEWPASVLGVWRQTQQQQGEESSCQRLVVIAQAGQATTCSQKIHNILCGIHVAQPLLQHWHQQQHQQHQQQQESLGSSSPSKQQQAAPLPGCPSSTTASCVQILAVAAGSSADGSNSSSSNTRSSSDSDAQQPAAGTSPPDAISSSSGSGSGYVCVLDDDVLLHPLGLMQLADELQADPRLFMTTGYPFDIVASAASASAAQQPDSSSVSSGGVLSAAWGRLLSYAAASYHLPLTIGFSIADRGNFVWGGAVMLRAAALVEQPPLHLWQQGQEQKQQTRAPNVLQVWRQGGYSDDLLLAAYCLDHGLSIGMPASAVYPQLLPAATTFTQYWNYLRRQLFVLDTYYSPGNRTTNHTMMLLHSYGSATFTAAAAAAALQLLAAAAVAAAAAGCWICRRLLLLLEELVGAEGGTMQQTLSQAAAWGCQQLCISGSDNNSSITSSSRLSSLLCPPGLCAFVVCIAAAQLSVWFLFEQCLVLMRVLSPSSPSVGRDGRDGRAGVSAGSAGPQSQPQQPAVQALLQGPLQLSYALLWVGWVFENALLPGCMAYTYVCDWIAWGGIWYRKGGGRVVEVVHPSAGAGSVGGGSAGGGAAGGTTHAHGE